MVQVSAIIAVYNGAATIAEAVDSALSQTWPRLEVIVTDDGSTDATRQILGGYGDRIKVITQSNRGPAAARNAAVRAASGEYLAFLDADDRWQPQMIERTVTALIANPACVMAFTNLAVIDSNGRSLDSTLVGAETAHAPTLDEMLARMWPIMTSAVVIRRQAFERAGGFHEEFKRASLEDIYLWIIVREQGPFLYVPEALAQWRFSLFPGRLKSVGGDPQPAKVFARLLSERYGVSVEPLLRARRRAARSILGYIGLLAMKEGDVARAREALGDALRIDPWRLRNYLRMIRTYLPNRIARALSGRTGRALRQSASQ
jgi:glycosyltransferase involved in cell wall biosynthesis